MLTIPASLLFLIHLTTCSDSQDVQGTNHAASFAVSPDRALINHVLKTIQSVDQFKCALLCMRQQGCLSANFYSNEESCELNERRREDVDSLDYIVCQGCFYMEIQRVKCASNPCLNNGACYLEYESNMQTSKCSCLSGYRGSLCEQEIIGYHEDHPSLSCKQIYDEEPSSPSGLYYFKNISGYASIPYQAYCFMGVIDSCGGGGWSLAMKIDGKKTTFHYNSSYWENKLSYNPAAGKTGFDAMETKIPFYWSMSITKLCLGMRTGSDQIIRWLKVPYSALSLHDVISTNTFHPVSTPRDQWKNLVPGSSLQTYYTRKGFNAKASQSDRIWINSRARIGVVGNNERDATTPDSRIGFGTGGSGRNEDDTNSCGNEAAGDIGADNDKVSIKAFCYILLQ
ncbi:uncharacterized protein LOC116300210 [Actinia tenebrosa]|uniref:Uncharacterized protein LOC116300210 n=1 Tax=Actinia tenebrosa TaxID=6105 RepID=A0A6P8I8J9_ACTTE|nr:uncharacterized protein LOC116300210 [Actinia tenebrosa]